MKYHELKVGMKVEDSWYSNVQYKSSNNWGTGKVVEILKTVFRVQFSNKEIPESVNGLVTYSRGHCQFIKPVGKNGKRKSA